MVMRRGIAPKAVAKAPKAVAKAKKDITRSLPASLPTSLPAKPINAINVFPFERA